MLSELDEMLDKLKQGASTSRTPVVDTTDTSGEDIETSQPRQRVLSKGTFKIEKSYATDELARYFLSGLIAALTNWKGL